MLLSFSPFSSLEKPWASSGDGAFLRCARGHGFLSPASLLVVGDFVPRGVSPPLFFTPSAGVDE